MIIYSRKYYERIVYIYININMFLGWIRDNMFLTNFSLSFRCHDYILIKKHLEFIGYPCFRLSFNTNTYYFIHNFNFDCLIICIQYFVIRYLIINPIIDALLII